MNFDRKNRLACALLIAMLSLLVPLAVSAKGQTQAAQGKTMEITWFGMAGGADNKGTTWLTQEVEKRFNVSIKWNGLHQDDTPEQVDVMIASGETPDVFYIHKDFMMLYRNGLTRSIPEDLVVKYAPNYTKTFKADDPLGWLMFRNPDNKSTFLTLLASRKWLDATFSYVAFREQWAKKAGMALPNYDQLKVPLDNLGLTKKPVHISYFYPENVTLEWFEKLLEAFRDGDYDGNGKNDTIPWAACKEWYWSWNPIMGAFGVARGYNVNVGGELYEWCIAPQYKEFLKAMARWWKKGLIDKEFPTLTWDKWDEKNVAGLTGACVSHFAYQAQWGGSPNGMVKESEVGTGAEVVTVRPPVGPTGLQGSPVYVATNGLRSGEYFGRKVDDAKLARVLQILDWLFYGDVEQWVWVTYGKPGVHSDWVGEPYKSQINRRPKDQIGGRQWWGSEWPSIGLAKHVPMMYSKEMADFWQNYIMGPKGEALAIRPYRYDILSETGLADVNVKYGASLNTFVDEFFYKAVTGQVDIDAAWDNYVKEWKNMGGDKVLAELKKSPITEEFRKGKLVY